jgi:two-component system, NtrC family, nitrogen regulation response regulator NtrX
MPSETSVLSQEMQPQPELVGVSKEVARMREFAKRAGPKKHTILLQGESGAGKDQMAEFIHAHGRQGEAFVPVDCGVISENLIESELFGHVRGAFTGTSGDKVGLIQAAEGGTLFLNEIANMSMAMQVKFLRLLEGKTFRQVGGLRDIKMNTRIIAASNANMEEAVRKGTMREDLFHRLNVIVFKVAPLRDHLEDVPPLAEYFLKQEGDPDKHFSKEALDAMKGYNWPGNVRELRNVVARAVFNSDGETEITKRHLELPETTSAPGIKW